MTGAAHGQTIPDRVVQHEFFELQLRSDDIVWLIRRSIPYRDLTGLHDAYDALLATVDDWLLERRIARGMLGTRKRTHMAWLFDVRAVSSHRNDDDFEKAVQRRQPHLIERSPLMAVLVKTATGRMQMNRLRRAEDQGEPEIFADANAAIQWLQQQLAKRSKYN